MFSFLNIVLPHHYKRFYWIFCPPHPECTVNVRSPREVEHYAFEGISMSRHFLKNQMLETFFVPRKSWPRLFNRPISIGRGTAGKRQKQKRYFLSGTKSA